MLQDRIMLEDEDLVIAIFDFFGFKAEKIPESNEKSPDFIIETDSKRILIELKTKYDSREFNKKRNNSLSSNGIFEHRDVLNRSNTMSRIIKDGYKQLKERKVKERADECYLFLLASEPFAYNKFEQFYSTVYGLKFIICLGESAPPPRNCFYYSFNDFYRFRDIIDGAIISDGKKLKFCINTFSPRYKYVNENTFINSFNPGIVDPMHMEKNGEAFVLDSDIDRRNIDELNVFLEKKYDLEKVAKGNLPSITIESTISIED